MYVVDGAGLLRAFDPAGVERWSRSIGTPGAPGPAIGADGTLAVGGGGAVWAFTPDGTLRWQRALGTGASAAPISLDAGGAAYVGGDDGYLYALGPNGDVRWRESLDGVAADAPEIGADGTLYVATRTGYLIAWVESAAARSEAQRRRTLTLSR